MNDLTPLPDREQIIADSVRSFLAVLPPELAETVRAAAIPHWFDAPLLAALLELPADEAELRYATLQEMPFVQVVGGRGHALHELTRRLLLDELWVEREADFRAWSRRAAGCFDGQADADDTARIEAIYHWLIADPDRGADLVAQWDAKWSNTSRYNLVYALDQAGLEHDAEGRLAGHARGWVYYSKGSLHWFYSENREAVESLRIASQAAGSDRQLAANCIRRLGDVHLALAEYPLARQRYEEARPIYHEIGYRRGEANCIRRLGDVHLYLAEYPRARQHYEEARPIYHEIGYRGGEANCIRRLGDVHLQLAEYPRARQRYEEARPIYHEIGDRLGEANCISSLGDVHLRLAEYPLARQRYEEARPIYHAIGDRLGEANCIRCLGDVHLQLAEYPLARQRYEEARPICHEIGDRLGEANCIQRLGELHLRLAEYPLARQRYEEARPIFHAIDARLGEAGCLLGLGDVTARMGDRPTARAAYDQAANLYQAIGLSYWEQVARDRMTRLGS